MSHLELYQRAELDYTYYLEKFAASESPIIYKKLSKDDKHAVDCLESLQLCKIIDGNVILDKPNIILWDTVYNRSLNWLIYYKSDLIRRKYENKGVNYDQIDKI